MTNFFCTKNQLNVTTYTLLAVTTSEVTFLRGWLVGWGLTALLTQNRSYRACRFV